MIKSYWQEIKKFDLETALIVAYSTFILLFTLYLGRTRYFLPAEPFLEKLILAAVIYGAAPVIPLLVFKNRPADYGISLGRPGIWLKDIAVLYAIMLVVLIIAFQFSHLNRVYPLYRRAGFHAGSFAVYELVQLLHMTCWEFFFRGFMLFGLSKKIDSRLAILIQTIPFALMHYRKPYLEAYGSIFAGIFLGITAARGRSFIPCAILHFSVALTADLLGIIF